MPVATTPKNVAISRGLTFQNTCPQGHQPTGRAKKALG